MLTISHMNLVSTAHKIHCKCECFWKETRHFSQRYFIEMMKVYLIFILSAASCTPCLTSSKLKVFRLDGLCNEVTNRAYMMACMMHNAASISVAMHQVKINKS